MLLDLNSVQGFVALFSERHFGNAAASLHLTTSALSKRIQKLERQLGVTLVERDHTPVVSFTAAGLRFAPRARRLIAESCAASISVREAVSTFEFRLGVPGSVGEFPERSVLVALGRELRNYVPGAVLHCHGLPFSELAAALRDDSVDVVWDTANAGHPDIELIPLTTYDRIGVVSRNHEFADATEVTVEQFADEPMIYGREVPTGWMRQWYLDDVRPVTEAKLVEMSASNNTGVTQSLAAGIGVTVAPATQRDHLIPALHAVELTGIQPSRTYAACRRGDHRDSVAILVGAMSSVAIAASTAAMYLGW
jgi:DNA-binding transcriptional LysR family regulator